MESEFIRSVNSEAHQTEGGKQMELGEQILRDV